MQRNKDKIAYRVSTFAPETVQNIVFLQKSFVLFFKQKGFEHPQAQVHPDAPQHVTDNVGITLIEKSMKFRRFGCTQRRSKAHDTFHD